MKITTIPTYLDIKADSQPIDRARRVYAQVMGEPLLFGDDNLDAVSVRVMIELDPSEYPSDEGELAALKAFALDQALTRFDELYQSVDMLDNGLAITVLMVSRLQLIRPEDN